MFAPVCAVCGSNRGEIGHPDTVIVADHCGSYWACGNPSAAVVGADVPVADIIGHDYKDVGFGLLRRSWRDTHHRDKGCEQAQAKIVVKPHPRLRVLMRSQAGGRPLGEDARSMNHARFVELVARVFILDKSRLAFSSRALSNQRRSLP